MKEQTNYQIQSIEQLFQERLKTLAKYNSEMKHSAMISKSEKDEILLSADAMLKSINIKYEDLMKKETNHLEQHKARELLKRRESQKNLRTMLSLEDWTSMLRTYSPTNDQ